MNVNWKKNLVISPFVSSFNFFFLTKTTSLLMIEFIPLQWDVRWLQDVRWIFQVSSRVENPLLILRWRNSKKADLWDLEPRPLIFSQYIWNSASRSKNSKKLRLLVRISFLSDNFWWRNGKKEFKLSIVRVSKKGKRWLIYSIFF